MAVAAAPADFEQPELNLDMLPANIRTAVVKCIVKYRDGLDHLPMRYLSEDLLLVRTLENLDRILDIPEKFQTDEFFGNLIDGISLNHYYFPRNCKKIFKYRPTHINATALALRLWRRVHKVLRNRYPHFYQTILNSLDEAAKTEEFYRAVIQLDKTHVCFLPAEQQTYQTICSALQVDGNDINWIKYLDRSAFNSAQILNAVQTHILNIEPTGDLPDALYTEPFVKQLISINKYWICRIPDKYLNDSIRKYHFEMWAESDASDCDSDYDSSYDSESD